MRVLISELPAGTLRRYQRCLSAMGHDVVACERAGSIPEMCANLRPDVAIVGEARAVPAIRQIPGHVYTIVALRQLEGAVVERVWHLGADDVMLRGASDEEVAGRVGALVRIKAWIGRLGEEFSQRTFDPYELTCVRTLDSLLAAEFTVMMGQPMMSERVGRIPALAFAAKIPLNLPEEKVELTLNMGVVPGSEMELGTKLFGEEVPAALIADALRELANTAGGTLKRAAMTESRLFSLGLPEDLSVPEGMGGVDAICLSCGGVVLYTWVDIHQDTPQRLAVSKLRAGMVLAEPVWNVTGTMLMNEGTVITNRTLAKLSALLGPDALVDVARATKDGKPKGPARPLATA